MDNKQFNITEMLKQYGGRKAPFIHLYDIDWDVTDEDIEAYMQEAIDINLLGNAKNRQEAYDMAAEDLSWTLDEERFITVGKFLDCMDEIVSECPEKKNSDGDVILDEEDILSIISFFMDSEYWCNNGLLWEFADPDMAS